MVRGASEFISEFLTAPANPPSQLSGDGEMAVLAALLASIALILWQEQSSRLWRFPLYTSGNRHKRRQGCPVAKCPVSELVI